MEKNGKNYNKMERKLKRNGKRFWGRGCKIRYVCQKGSDFFCIFGGAGAIEPLNGMIENGVEAIRGSTEYILYPAGRVRPGAGAADGGFGPAEGRSRPHEVG